ncbi:MAG: RHS repeat-associated core domain-containing protein, partial [Acidobacteriota bacterium]
SGSVCTKCTSGTVALTDGTPVAGVSVSASNASATTDETGLYILQPPGNGQGSQQGVEGTIVPSLTGYAFTPGRRACDSRHTTHQDFTAVPHGQGAVKEGSNLTGGSGKPGAGSPPAGSPQAGNPPTRHPEAGPSGRLAQDPAGQAASSYGVRPHGGPGPSPFGRSEACSGMDASEADGMEAEAAPAAATRAEAAAVTNTATYFYVWDQVGSVRLVMDGTGAVVVEHDYEPYGVEILPNNPTSMPTNALPGTHLYTGQERDADTGLDNFHFRSYASTMGRFLSPDSLPGNPLNPQSFNLYAYVHGNPVNYNDPTGHWAGGLPPGQQYYYGDPFGGLNFPPSGGSLEPESLLDALMDSTTGNQSTQSASQPAAQDKQTSSPTAGQEGTKATKQNMSLSQKGLKFIAGHEGFGGKTYKDSAGNPTIGYGHLIKAGEDFSKGVTKKQALALLKGDVHTAVDAVNGGLSTSVSQSRFDAMVDLAYNIGGHAFRGSSLLKDVNASRAVSEGDFTQWDKAGGSPVQGLLSRREDEYNLFSKGDYGGGP